MSGGVHFRGLAPGQHSSEKMSQRWRVVSDTESNLTGPEIEPKTSRTDSNVLATEVTGRFCKNSSLSPRSFILCFFIIHQDQFSRYQHLRFCPHWYVHQTYMRDFKFKTGQNERNFIGA